MTDRQQEMTRTVAGILWHGPERVVPDAVAGAEHAVHHRLSTREGQGDVVKTHATTTIVAGLLSLVASAAVRADSLAMRALVPFEFTAGTTTLPAGTYTVARLDASPQVILVRGPKKGVFLMTQRGDSKSTPEVARLIFRRYGDRHFLHEVSFGNGVGYSVPETSEEREWADKRAEVAPATLVVQLAIGPE